MSSHASLQPANIQIRRLTQVWNCQFKAKWGIPVPKSSRSMDNWTYYSIKTLMNCTLYIFLQVPFPEPLFEINTFLFSCSLSQFHLISCVESQKFLEVYIYYMLHAPVQNRDFLVLSIKQNEGATLKTPRSHPLVKNWSTHIAPRQKNRLQ